MKRNCVRATKRGKEAWSVSQDAGVPARRIPDACYLNAAVAVVPLRHGGGTKPTVLETFGNGCPMISMTKGFDGSRRVTHSRFWSETIWQDSPTECCSLRIRNLVDLKIDGVLQELSVISVD